MNEDDQNYLFGQAKSEEDQPLEPTSSRTGNGVDLLEERKLQIKEREKERQEKRYFSAFGLIEICLAILVGVYLLETFVEFKTGFGAEGIANNLVEIVKTLLFTLSGYLFARKENGD